jgi:hypothetical protein
MSTRTTPVKYWFEPLVEGCEPARVTTSGLESAALAAGADPVVVDAGLAQAETVVSSMVRRDVGDKDFMKGPIENEGGEMSGVTQ